MQFSCVNDKISGVFQTENRPLKEGEVPKRPGDTTVFQAKNEISAAFKEVLESGEPVTVSWKIDGTCCKIVDGIYYRRRDIRKGSVPPAGSIPGDIDENGVARIAWVPLNTSNEPEDKYHLSAFSDDRLSIWVLDTAGMHLMAINEIKKATTFELIGPKVQDNLYSIEETPVMVPLRKKTESVPRHYLVPHGCFTAPLSLDIFKENNALDTIKEFVQRNRAEGLVFRCGDRYFKVNQGHLQCHNRGDKLLLSGI